MTELDSSALSSISRIPILKSTDLRGSLSKLEILPEWKMALGNSAESIIFSRNESAGTVRGFHFQTAPKEEIKILFCLQGKIDDFNIDIRKNSPIFGAISKNQISEESDFGLLIPPGFAHGYQTLKPNTLVGYFILGSYSKDHYYRINPLDRVLDIRWEIEVTEVSQADLTAPSLAEVQKLIAAP